MSKILTIIFLLSISTITFGQTFEENLQNQSITVVADGFSGTGMLITRTVKVNDKDTLITFCWTAGHVINNSRNLINKKIEYGPILIIKEDIQEGHKIAEIQLEGKVIKWSGEVFGQDLALIRILKTNFLNINTKFYLDNKIPKIGTKIFHIGSLHGIYENSLTQGIVSYSERVLTLNNRPQIFLQSNITVATGSSGGGIYFAEGPNQGKCLGMLLRLRENEPTINFSIGTNKIKEWAVKNNVLWALDEKEKMPTFEELKKLDIEDK